MHRSTIENSRLNSYGKAERNSDGRSESLPSGCIGRETELTRLLDAYESGKKTGGHAFFLCGPNGVGKSSLFQELKRRLRHSGIGVMEIFCRQGTAPFETTAALVRQASAYLEESAPNAFENPGGLEVSRLAASLQSIGYSNAGNESLETAQRTSNSLSTGSNDLFETAIRFLTLVSKVDPPAIIIHDLERAGSSVLREIERLVAGLLLTGGRKSSQTDEDPFFRGLFLFSVRTELEKVTVRDLPFWAGGVSHEILRLSGLEREGVAAFLRSEAAVERFTRLTGGNPRNLKSLLTWGSPDADEVIRSRLIPISEDARALAACCALSDRPVGTALLKRLTRFNSKRIGSSIEELLSSGLMKHSIVTGELQIRFCNSGDQDTVIEATPPDELRKWRMRIAEALLEDGDKVSAVEQMLVAAGGAPTDFHAEHGHTWKHLHDIVLDAGNMLEVSGDSDRAAKIYERALETVSVKSHAIDSETAHEAAKEIRFRLIRILELHGRYSDALRIVETAGKDDPENLELMRLYGRLACLKGLRSEAEACLLDGKKSARDREDAFVEAQFSTELCEVYFKNGSHHSEVESECRHAVGLIDKCSPSPACEELRSMVSLVAGKKAMEEGELQAAAEHFNEALESARACSSLRQEIRSLINLGINHLKKGEHSAARDLYSVALDAALSGHDIGHQAFCLQNLAVLSHWRRDYETALRRFHEAVAVFQRLGNTTILSWLALDLGELYLELGDNGRSVAMLQLSRDLTPDPVHGSLEIYRSLLDGRIAVDSGLFLKAKQQFLRARKAAQRLDRAEDAGIALLELARLEMSLGNAEAAKELILEIGTPPTQKLNALKLRLESEIENEADGKFCRTRLLNALQLFEMVEDPDGLWKTQVLLFREAQKGGNRADAAKWKRTAKRTESKIRSTVPDEFLQSYLQSASRWPYLEQICAGELDSLDSQNSIAFSGRNSSLLQEDEDSALSRVSRQASEALAALVGRDKNFLDVINALKKVAPINSTVLLRGESGTGKELAARAIHFLSNRAEKPLVGVNCGALVETLLLSELFGHERGAFTGATRSKKGRFELAEGGTLFLDEIGDISPRTQVALLRVLQEKCFERVGGTESINANVRIVLATNRNLENMVREGTFREDLYYRIKTLEIELPPLRHRGEDVILISREICRKLGSQERGAHKSLSREAENLLLSHPWYGNVRELENVLRSCWIFCEGDQIPGSLVSRFISQTSESGIQQCGKSGLRCKGNDENSHVYDPAVERDESPASSSVNERIREDSSPETSSVDWFALMKDEGISLKDMKKQIELECIQKALEQSDRNITQAAKLLGMKRPRLSQLVKEYGLN